MIKKLLHAFSLTDPKYLPMMGLPLLVPYLALGPANGWIMAGGAIAVVLLNMAAVLVNTWSDRAGDAISFPKGYAATARHIGYNNLKIWIAILYALLTFSAGLMAAIVSIQVAMIYTAGAVVATALLRRAKAQEQHPVQSPVHRVRGHRSRSSAAGRFTEAGSAGALAGRVVAVPRPGGQTRSSRTVLDADGDRRMDVRTLFTGVRRETLAFLLPVLWTILCSRA